LSEEAYPLAWPIGWPRHKGAQDSDSRFKGPTFRWDRVYHGLVAELTRIGARNVVVSTNQPVRRDGLPYAQERIIRDVGVAVYFARGDKALVMAQDRFYTVIGNMRSLAMAVEGLRQMERHGGAVMMERAFSGFTAIAGPTPSRHWSDVLEVRRDVSREIIEANFRRLARDRHPDNGGSDAAMSELNVARDQALKEAAHGR
jgi:hypothetical protein